MNGIVRWADPPRNAIDDARDTVKALMARPRRWALLQEGVPGYVIDEAMNLIEGADLADAIEFKIVPLGEAPVPKDLYARFVPRHRFAG